MTRHRQLLALGAAIVVLAFTPIVSAAASPSAGPQPRADGDGKQTTVVTGGRTAEAASLIATGPQRFYPITPFRTYDTRLYSYGVIRAGDEFIFDVLTDSTGGSQLIPSGANAVTFNLTITQTSGLGFLALYPSEVVWPGNSSINWTGTGQTLANSGVVSLTQGIGEIAVYAGGSFGTSTHFIIDITGYYAP